MTITITLPNKSTRDIENTTELLTLIQSVSTPKARLALMQSLHDNQALLTFLLDHYDDESNSDGTPNLAKLIAFTILSFDQNSRLTQTLMQQMETTFSTQPTHAIGPQTVITDEDDVIPSHLKSPKMQQMLLAEIVKLLLLELVDPQKDFEGFQVTLHKITSVADLARVIALLNAKPSVFYLAHFRALQFMFQDSAITASKLKPSSLISEENKTALVLELAQCLYQVQTPSSPSPASSSTESSSPNAISQLWDKVTEIVSARLGLASSSDLSASSDSPKRIDELPGITAEGTTSFTLSPIAHSILNFIQKPAELEAKHLGYIIQNLVYPFMTIACLPTEEARTQLSALVQEIETMASDKNQQIAYVQKIDAIITHFCHQDFDIDAHCLLSLRTFLYAVIRQLRENSTLYPQETTKTDFLIATITRFGKTDKVAAAINLCLSIVKLLQHGTVPQLLNTQEAIVSDGELGELYKPYLRLRSQALGYNTAPTSSPAMSSS